ncbi:HlyD family efflux transporter periplasmic adaptor subunit [Pseudanabaena sp. PCC 6802]|uniref:HlyD family efflux transporter periplasmic adaptor subunit n=1 Tax=Pseudanabaena sp. PCC 6802 TaxID=118173 RepID=UPI00034A27E1|nr:HlyD family efflux transporter periplasmic adaptor subunit [Pseudanabaena sp. PCC 6802]
MSNPSNLTEQLAQRNGHYKVAPNVSESLTEIDIAEARDRTLSTLRRSQQVQTGNSPEPVEYPEVLASSSDDWDPLTQDLIDTMPRVWTRGLLYFLVGFAAIALPWAMFSQVDQTGIARGRLEPKGKTFKLDAPVAGKVVAIDVKEGSTVKAGQPLLSLESDLVLTDLQQSEAKLEGQLNRLAQLERVKNQLSIATRTQQLLSQAQTTEQLAQTSQVETKLISAQRAYRLAQERLNQDLREVERYRSLSQEGVVPEIKLVELERTASESKRLFEQAQADIQQTQSELKKQGSSSDRVVRTGELAIVESEKQAEELKTQMGDLRSEIAQTRKAIASLKWQLQQRIIRAPVSGTIFQLPIQKAGAVVQPGTNIAQIAPNGVPLIIRAEMPISESGFLRVGMPVQLKFDAYPFQDYGVVPGKVSWVSPDSKQTQTAQGQVETFELEIIPDRTEIQAQNKRVALTPGQTATAEVIVRQRRVIDLILDPFKQLQSDGLKL